MIAGVMATANLLGRSEDCPQRLKPLSFCSIYGTAESRPLNCPNQQSWPGTPSHYIRTFGANWLHCVHRDKRVLHFVQDDNPQSGSRSARMPRSPRDLGHPVRGSGMTDDRLAIRSRVSERRLDCWWRLRFFLSAVRCGTCRGQKSYAAPSRETRNSECSAVLCQ